MFRKDISGARKSEIIGPSPGKNIAGTTGSSSNASMYVITNLNKAFTIHDQTTTILQVHAIRLGHTVTWCCQQCFRQ